MDAFAINRPISVIYRFLNGSETNSKNENKIRKSVLHKRGRFLSFYLDFFAKN